MGIRLGRALRLCLVLLPLLTGIGACDGDLDDSLSHQAQGESWTVLVYMASDNNLETYAIDELIEMMAVGSAPGFNLVVQVDRAIGYSDAPLAELGDFQSAKRLLVEAGALIELEDIGEPNMANAQTLADFIHWGVESYPADRVALILWNHGGAWPGYGSDEVPLDRDVMRLSELEEALAEGLDRAGLSQLALIGFDACLMATWETALSVAPYAEYLLASEALEPALGWNYEALGLLRESPGSAPPQLAEAIIQGYLNQGTVQGGLGRMTLSLVDLYALGPIAAALDEFGAAALGEMSSLAPRLAEARARATSFGDSPVPAWSAHMVDLGDLLLGIEALGLSPEHEALGALAAEAAQRLDAAVIARAEGALGDRARGLSVYFPKNKLLYDTDYDHLLPPELETWRALLWGFYSEGEQASTLEPLSFDDPDHEAGVEVGPGDVLIAGTLQSGSATRVSEAELHVGVLTADPELIILLCSLGATFDVEGRVEGRWPRDLLRVTDGTRSVPVFATRTQMGSYQFTRALFEATGPTVPEGSVAVLDRSENSQQDLVNDVLYLMTGTGVGEINAASDIELHPLVLFWHADGRQEWTRATSTGFRVPDGIEIERGPLSENKQVYLSLTVEDFAGQSDGVYAIVDGLYQP